MKQLTHIFLVAVAFLAAITLCSCHKISLGSTGLGKVTSPQTSKEVAAPLDGDWIITFEYKGQDFDSNVTFSQKGDQLAGQGTDPSGAAFYLQEGSVKGKHVHFSKRYADVDPNKPSVDYDGDLQWADVEGYKGWEIAGHYKTTAGETGKWIAVPKEVPQQAAIGDGQQEQPGQVPEGEGGGEQVAGGGEPDQGGGAAGGSPGHEPNISGMYEASYNFNFKRIHSKLWLAQDGHQVTGHGVDTNTNEQFVISKGFYSYPKVTLICKYTKGKNAAANRDITFKAKVTQGPQMKGETQFGGGWEAHIVR